MNKLARASVVAALSLAYLAYVFHIFSPVFWQSSLGDWGDPYFINFLLEHWYYSLWHLADPSSPLMYFPARHSLGYSHALILFAPFYLVVRPLLHPFIAYNVALLLVIETGIVCLYLLFRRWANLSALEAIVLTAFFCTSQNVINGSTAIWSQRLSVFLLPPILLLMTSRHAAAAFVSGLLAALLLTQDYPTAVFTLIVFGLTVSAPLFASVWKHGDRILLVALVLVIAWGFYTSMAGGIDVRILGVRIRSSEWPRTLAVAIALFATIVIRNRRRITPWIPKFAAGAVIGIVIFLWVYLPAYREGHQFAEQDLMHALSTSFRPFETMRPFMLLIVVVLADRKARLAAIWFLLVSAIVYVVALRIGDFSLWRAALTPIPGFAAVRDPRRIIYVYELAVVLGAAALMMRTTARFRAIVVAIALVLMAANWNRETFKFERPKAIFDQWVAAPIAIDPSCRSFFIKGASAEYMSRSPFMWMLYGVDAMFVATRHSIPTINGYSAWAPPGWELANPQEASYPGRVEEWIRRNRLADVCAFDIERRTMR